ncbi:MAG: HAD hydrolase family protein, partial [Candidatus Bathyarchaeia archaeon]
MKPIFISDCEGPISKNDNAYEITAHFVPNGDKLFALISKYDDVLADVFKRPGYSAGSTLKLILPFLKAYDITDVQMEEFSAENLILIANSRETLQHVQTVASAFIVSTSYEHYIKALCRATTFPYENTYCTKLRLSKYNVSEKEKDWLKKIAKEIAQTPMISIPPAAKTIEDFSPVDQETIRRLDKIFWGELADTGLGRILEVTTVGGSQKAEAIEDAVKRVGAQLSDVIYVGDSITDVEAFKLVRSRGGFTVSFNGNEYAVKNAEVAVLSENSIVTAVIAELFFYLGKQRTLALLENWRHETLQNKPVSPHLRGKLFALYPTTLPKVQIVTVENMDAVAKESS